MQHIIRRCFNGIFGEERTKAILRMPAFKEAYFLSIDALPLHKLYYPARVYELSRRMLAEFKAQCEKKKAGIAGSEVDGFLEALVEEYNAAHLEGYLSMQKSCLLKNSYPKPGHCRTAWSAVSPRRHILTDDAMDSGGSLHTRADEPLALAGSIEQAFCHVLILHSQGQVHTNIGRMGYPLMWSLVYKD